MHEMTGVGHGLFRSRASVHLPFNCLLSVFSAITCAAGALLAGQRLVLGLPLHRRQHLRQRHPEQQHHRRQQHRLRP